MFYKPHLNTRVAAAPTTAIVGDKSLDSIELRKKTYSIKPLKHFSPNRVVQNPQDKRKKEIFGERKLEILTLKPSTGNIKTPHASTVNLRDRDRVNEQISLRIASNNVRSTFSPVPFARRDRQMIKSKDNIQSPEKISNNNFLKLKRPVKQTTKKDEKKSKEAPSFIKNKFHHNSPIMEDFKIVRKIKDGPEYKQYVVAHKKTHSIFVIKSYQWLVLSREKQLAEEIKFYLKNIQISHNLIIKCFGYFYDTEYLHLIEQFPAGEHMTQYLITRKDPMGQHEVGPRVCELLTAISYLHSINFVYGNINQSSVINSINICKLKRPYLAYQKRDIMFDIWCLGKLTYEMITSRLLIDQHLLVKLNNVKQIFKSNEIVLSLQVGFKIFEGSSFSRDLIKFLITTLWEIQNGELSIQDVWQLQFIKLYKEDDIWQQPCKK